MHYLVSKKNLKQSIQNLANYFKEKNVDIPRNLILEGFARSMFFKNWNTLEGISSKTEIIKHIPLQKSYMLEIDCSLNKEEFLNLIKTSLEKARCKANINNIVAENKSYHLELSLPEKGDNFLTAIMVMGESLKNHDVTRFDLLRIVVEKESVISFTNKKKVTNSLK